MKELVKGETKKDKFRRLAGRRTTEVLNKLRILGNCANTTVYEYSQEDIDKIFRAIEKGVKETRILFKTKETTEFKWSE